ncbi:MAG: (Fe-S)-binding protein [Acidimicrobiales bacterium]
MAAASGGAAGGTEVAQPGAVDALTLAPDRAFMAKLEELAGPSLEMCYQCGTCSVVCPFSFAGTKLPRQEMLLAQWGLKEALFDSPNLWICTTCGNCARLCPRGVEIPRTIAAARELYLAERGTTPELATAFENTVRHGNPLGASPRQRGAWAANAGVEVPVMAKVGRPVDVLLFTECYWSYHPRGQDAARAMARVLGALGVDYAILGPEETCVADSQRLAGETGIFEMAAEKNIATLAKYEFNRLVTPDPHAYNAFKNLYPALGGTYDVSHYTQLLAGLIGELAFSAAGPVVDGSDGASGGEPVREPGGEPVRRVTFHDPCYLGRHNGEFEAPRRLIEALPGMELAEMANCRENGYCCGGGGGGIWNSGYVAGQVDERLAERRVKEAVQTGAEVLAVCCPFEVSLFEDAVKSTGNSERLVVRDIVELIDASMAR